MRILYVGPNRIGDAILSSGVLNFLCRNYPDAQFTVACGALAAPLFEELPGLERLIAMHKLPRGGHWWRLWRQVVGHRWSLVVDVRRSIIPWTVVNARRAIAPRVRSTMNMPSCRFRVHWVFRIFRRSRAFGSATGIARRRTHCCRTRCR